MAALDVSVMIDSADCEPRHQCTLGDDTQSWALLPISARAQVFIKGTPQQVSELALKLARAVSQHCVAEVERAIHGEVTP